MSCTEPQSIGGAFSSFPLRCHGRGKVKTLFHPVLSCPAQLQRESPFPGDSSSCQVGCMSSPAFMKTGTCTHSTLSCHLWGHFPIVHGSPCWSTKFLFISNPAELLLFILPTLCLYRHWLGWLDVDTMFYCVTWVINLNQPTYKGAFGT